MNDQTATRSAEDGAASEDMGQDGGRLAIDRQTSRTLELYLSEKRDINAAKAFLRKAMKSQRIPTKITLDA